MRLTSLISTCLAAGFLMTSLNAVAQSARKTTVPTITKDQAAELKKTASEDFKNENYRAAFDDYSKLVQFDPNDLDYNYRMGMCYLNTNSEKGKAVEYFVKCADKKDAPKDVYYQMGRSLLVAGLFDEAIEAFDKYKEVNHGSVNSKYNLDQYVEYCYNAKEYVKKPLDVKFTNPGKVINTKGAEYAPVSMALDTILFFTSGRQGNTGGIVDGFGEIVPDIYYSSRQDTSWTKAKNAGININGEFYDISTGMTSNGDKLLIYKESVSEVGDIFVSELQGKTWQKAQLIDPSLETKVLETGGCLSNDGKRLFFAADMKGTLGGKDIYMMEMDDNKKWGSPVNLGPTINTKFDEDNPVLWHDGKTLFFASKGHNSMGGYDIFQTSRPDPSAEWSKPMNIGYPLNTFDDDMYFTLAANGRTGYVASVRPKGMGDLDIWYFALKEPLIKNAGTLFRASILTPQGLPAKDAICSVVKESTGEVLGVMDASGAASEIFILLPPGNYKLKARSAKAGRLEADIAVTGDEGEKGIRKVFKLQDNPSSKP